MRSGLEVDCEIYQACVPRLSPEKGIAPGKEEKRRLGLSHVAKVERRGKVPNALLRVYNTRCMPSTLIFSLAEGQFVTIRIVRSSISICGSVALESAGEQGKQAKSKRRHRHRRSE